MLKNVLHAKKEDIYPSYVSKHNSNREKQVMPIMIPNEERCHYLEVKKLLALLRELTLNHHNGFYCLNCFHSFTTEI